MFGFEVVLYLCLGGIGGGLSAVAGLAGLSIPRRLLQDGLFSPYSNLMRSAFVISLTSLLLGSLLLLADSGNFPALVYLFLTPPFSYLSVGAWVIVIDMMLCFVLLLLWKGKMTGAQVVASRVLHALCAVVGLAVALYTGLFLASMKAVPLWNTPLLPTLFVLSSISCGLVLFLVLIKTNGKAALFPSYIKLLAKVDIVVVALELVCAAALILGLVMFSSNEPTGAAGVASALDMVTGEHAWVWWGGFVGLGLIATAMLDVLVIRAKGVGPGRAWSTLGVTFCVLVGAFSLRYCIVAAGAHPAFGL